MERYIALIVIFIVIHRYAKTLINTIASLGGMMPRWLSWLRWFVKKLTSPNALSLYQLPLLWLIYQEVSSIMMAIYFSLSAILDRFDGLVARIFNTKTKIGEFLDTFIDKVMVTGTTYKCYITFGFNPTVKIMIIIMLIMDSFRILFTVAQYSPIILLRRPFEWEVKSNLWGKTKRCFQTASILIFLLNPNYENFAYEAWLVGMIGIAAFCGFMSNVGHVRPSLTAYQKLTKLANIPFQALYKAN